MVSADAVAVDDRESLSTMVGPPSRPRDRGTREPVRGRLAACPPAYRGSAEPRRCARVSRTEPRRWLEQSPRRWWSGTAGGPPTRPPVVLSGAGPAAPHQHHGARPRARIIKRSPRASSSRRRKLPQRTLAEPSRLKLPKNVADRHRLNGDRPPPPHREEHKATARPRPPPQGNWAQRREGCDVGTDKAGVDV